MLQRSFARYTTRKFVEENRLLCTFVKVLADNTSISTLNISHNVIGDDGMHPIARLLEKNKTLRSVDMEFNSFTPWSGKHLMKSLNNNVFLTNLCINEGDDGPPWAEILHRRDHILQSNTKFQLVCTRFFLFPLRLIPPQIAAVRQ